jgi:LmbE family N-acetylglucosaminyl deacetylase
LRDHGWQIEFATMTAGDVGSSTLPRKEISRIRKAEAAASARILGGNYYCMECDDIFVLYDRPTLLKVIKLIRQVRPKVVFTMSPQDYMNDHEVTSALVRTACFSAGIRNIKTSGAAAFLSIPHLYYLDPIDGKDTLGNRIAASTVVDISSTMQTKERMFRCHASQRSWLQAHHKIEDYVDSSLKQLSAMRGKEVGVPFAEGFRQHLGHSFPQDNFLEQELGDLVHCC